MNKVLVVLIFIFMGFNLFAKSVYESLSDDPVEIAMFSYVNAHKVSGSEQQMAKRAMVLFNLYLDSNKNFAFAYSITHLTLAIERSATSPRVEKTFNAFNMENYARAWKDWGVGLKRINQQMVQRLHFAYELTKILHIKELKVFPAEILYAYPNIQQFYDETMDLFPSLMQIHRARFSRVNLSAVQIDEHFERFVYWEHFKIIQPRIQPLYEELPSLLRRQLRNVPGRFTEVVFLKPLKLRTTLNLKCFKDTEYLKTDDFMDPIQRQNQARAFYSKMKQINFDPNYECFDEKYYITTFPFAFLENNQEAFAKMYYDVLSSARIKSDNEFWLHNQYKNIPLEEFASLPSANVPINLQDRQMLSFKTNPIVKNNYINSAYHQIAADLSQCLNVSEDMGNWYDFAKWASLSGGLVINESKFKELSYVRKAELNIAERMDWTSKDAQVGYFVRANTLIALEMLPLGRLFLKEYCQGAPRSEFESFKPYISKEGLHRNYIQRAFENYFKAINETDRLKRIELVALASTLQVMGEQLRVDDNLDAVFDLNSRSELSRNWFSLASTKQGGLQLGNSPSYVKVDLHKDISTDKIQSPLLDLKNPEYIQLHHEYSLPIDLSKQKTINDTKVEDWGRWRERFKFLIAMFRSNISFKGLREAPAQVAD